MHKSSFGVKDFHNFRVTVLQFSCLFVVIQGRRDILRVLLRQLPCPYRRYSDRKGQQEPKTPLDTKAVVDDAINSFENLTIDSETEISGQESVTGSGEEESAAEESAEVDDATLTLLAANSHG